MSKRFAQTISGMVGTSDNEKRYIHKKLVDLENEAASPKIGYEVVDTLPEEGENGVIYLVPSQDPTSESNYDEWVYTLDGEWEKLGAADDVFEPGSGDHSAQLRGGDNNASGAHSTAEGLETVASGIQAHAEGTQTVASGTHSHAEGWRNLATGNYTHSEGTNCVASGFNSHAEGGGTVASGRTAHSESGNWIMELFPVGAAGATQYTMAINAEIQTKLDQLGETVFCNIHKTNYIWDANWAFAAKITNCVISGNDVVFTLDRTLSEAALTGSTPFLLSDSLAYGAESHSEGGSIAYGSRSHSEGRGTASIGHNSHTEGQESVTYAETSHAEGYQCETGGSRASNNKTPAPQAYPPIQQADKVGAFAHAEGNATIAQGLGAHSEGKATFGKGEASHAEGAFTEALNEAEHAEGKYNKSNQKTDGTAEQNAAGTTQHSVGIGTSANDRKNAFEIMQNGDVYVVGLGGYDGTNAGASGVLSLQQILAGIETLLSQI